MRISQCRLVSDVGVDRDSEILGPVFDERNPAVIRALTMALDGAQSHGRKIGICGQAPSDYPEIAELLVRHGIDSLSLSTDVVIATRIRIAELERRLEDERGTGESQ